MFLLVPCWPLLHRSTDGYFFFLDHQLEFTNTFDFEETVSAMNQIQKWMDDSQRGKSSRTGLCCFKREIVALFLDNFAHFILCTRYFVAKCRRIINPLLLSPSRHRCSFLIGVSPLPFFFLFFFYVLIRFCFFLTRAASPPSVMLLAQRRADCVSPKLWCGAIHTPTLSGGSSG